MGLQGILAKVHHSFVNSYNLIYFFLSEIIAMFHHMNLLQLVFAHSSSGRKEGNLSDGTACVWSGACSRTS